MISAGFLPREPFYFLCRVRFRRTVNKTACSILWHSLSKFVLSLGSEFSRHPEGLSFRETQRVWFFRVWGLSFRDTHLNLGRDPFNQNFRKFRSKTQWIGSVQPEKFRKDGSTFWGGPLFPVGPVGILVEWIAPLAVLWARVTTALPNRLEIGVAFHYAKPTGQR